MKTPVENEVATFLQEEILPVLSMRVSRAKALKGWILRCLLSQALERITGLCKWFCLNGPGMMRDPSLLGALLRAAGPPTSSTALRLPCNLSCQLTSHLQIPFHIKHKPTHSVPFSFEINHKPMPETTQGVLWNL